MSSSPPKGQIYDSIASDYDVIWNVPAVKFLLPLVETNLKQLGSWNNSSIIDFACGTGIGLRLMKQLGASKLVGVDISNEMLDVCRATFADNGFELHHADCSQPLDHTGVEKGSFDLVLAFWLLNYAESREQIAGMWQNIAAYLKPGGGTFVGIIQNQDEVHPKSMQGKIDIYGAQESNVQELPSGDGVKMHVEFATEPKIEFDAFVLKKDILEEEAAKAGMKHLRYVRPGEEVKGVVEGKSEEWWRELLEEYPNQLIIASREIQSGR